MSLGFWIRSSRTGRGYASLLARPSPIAPLTHSDLAASKCRSLHPTPRVSGCVARSERLRTALFLVDWNSTVFDTTRSCSAPGQISTVTWTLGPRPYEPDSSFAIAHVSADRTPLVAGVMITSVCSPQLEIVIAISSTDTTPT